MSTIAKVESGTELLARLTPRPSIEGLESQLFATGPNRQETIELCGNVSSGKTLLLTQLIAKCILPYNHDNIQIGGLGVAAVLINTDHHFRIAKLAKLMLGFVEKACRNNNHKYHQESVKNDLIIPSLENLTIVDCYDNIQFRLTLKNLESILMKNTRIGLIAIDSISSFYWQDRESGGVWLMHQYLKNTLKLVQTHTIRHNIVTIYTRPDDFVSKGQSNAIELTKTPAVEKISYRINLGTGSFCLVETPHVKFIVDFKINEKGITWIEKKEINKE